MIPKYLSLIQTSMANLFPKVLIGFRSSAEENIIKYFNVRFQGENPVLEPVMVTKAEEKQATDLENLTKDALKKKIFDQIILLDPSNETLQEEVFNKSIKRGAKEKYITF